MTQEPEPEDRADERDSDLADNKAKHVETGTVDSEVSPSSQTLGELIKEHQAATDSSGVVEATVSLDALDEVKFLDYHVKDGDTLEGIANKFDTSVGNLQSWNSDINQPGQLGPGMQLHVGITFGNTLNSVLGAKPFSGTGGMGGINNISTAGDASSLNVDSHDGGSHVGPLD